MPRMPRNYANTPFFHIMTQGINKNYIFSEPEDIKYYIQTMYKLTCEHQINIIAYCIMSNHSHILLQIHDVKELSKYMQRLNTRYGKYYNNKYNRVGYVFRDRYKSEGIYNEKQLNNCIHYIYNNPVKAKICKNPIDYPYSNCKKRQNYIENNEYAFIDVDEDKKAICHNIVNEFLIQNNLEISSLKNNRYKLQQLLIILKDTYTISLRCISEELKINRETIRKLYYN